MKRNTLLRLALIGLVGVGIQNAHAGSAVAWDGYAQLSTAYGGPVEREKLRALDTARRKGGTNVRIVAATDATGYGAIAVALQPGGHGSIIGVSLGNRSATQADAAAIKDCLKAGGRNPKVRWEWKG